jgi:hypothetical protein
MEQSPTWQATIHSACQEIPRLLGKPKIVYYVQKSPPLVPILSRILGPV